MIQLLYGKNVKGKTKTCRLWYEKPTYVKQYRFTYVGCMGLIIYPAIPERMFLKILAYSIGLS